MHLKRPLITFISLLVLTLYIASCSKKKAPQISSSLLDATILRELPTDTFAFYFWKASNPAFKKLTSSEFSSSQKSFLFSSLETTNSKNKELTEIISTLEKFNFLTGTEDAAYPIDSAVLFSSTSEASTDQVEFGAYFLFEKKINNVQLISKLKEASNKSTNLPEQITIKDSTGFSILLNETPNTPAPSTLYVAATKYRLAFTSSKQNLVSFLSASTPDGISKIKLLPSFKKSLLSLNLSNDDFAFGYINPEPIVHLSESAAPNTPLALLLKQLPILAVAFANGMDSSPYFKAVLPVSPKNEEQTNLFSRMRNAPPTNALSNAPDDTMLLLDINGAIIDEIIDGIQRSREVPQEIKESVANLSESNSLSLVARDNPSGNFPDLALILSSKNSEHLHDLLKNTIEEAMKSQQSPMMANKWSHKDINNQPTDFFLLPLVGIGVYLTDIDNNLLISTSETMSSDLIDTITEKKNNLIVKLDSKHKDLVNRKQLLYTQFINFPALASTAKRLSQTLSIFTGGKPAFDTKQLDAYDKLGISVVTTRYEKDTFFIEGKHSKPQ